MGKAEVREKYSALRAMTRAKAYVVITDREILFAGKFGNLETALALQSLKTLKAGLKGIEAELKERLDEETNKKGKK